MKNASPLMIYPITTRIFKSGESLTDFIVDHVELSHVKESMMIAVTSKIVSLAETRLISKTTTTKSKLIDQEADYNFGEVAYGCYLTVKEGLFIPSAGIDESNSENDHYILYPKNPFLSAKTLWDELRQRWGIQKLGVLLTDSHTTPLRKGVTGISLAHWGFSGLNDLIGKPDLFGRKMKMTTVNAADALACAATLLMGEANECRPLALIQTDQVEFKDHIDPHELKMPLEQDLYFPFFKSSLGHK